MATFVSLSHYTDENGDIVRDMPTPAKRISQFFGSIVAFMTQNNLCNNNKEYRTFTKCRKRPSHKPCPGKISALYDEDGESFFWICPECGDNGLISDWQGTVWDYS